MIVGRTYIERGEPVTVLVQWNARRPAPVTAPAGSAWDMPLIGARRSGPRNVLIHRADGTLIVRPFRGLRVPAPASAPGTRKVRWPA